MDEVKLRDKREKRRERGRGEVTMLKTTPLPGCVFGGVLKIACGGGVYAARARLPGEKAIFFRRKAINYYASLFPPPGCPKTRDFGFLDASSCNFARRFPPYLVVDFVLILVFGQSPTGEVAAREALTDEGVCRYVATLLPRALPSWPEPKRPPAPPLFFNTSRCTKNSISKQN